MIKVLNLLSTGGVGGIEQLCNSIGKYADYQNVFCFLFGEGQIFEEMKLKGLNVISLAEDSKGKFSFSKWKKLCKVAKDYDIIVTHHCTISLQVYYALLCKKFKKKKHVMTVHSCFEKEYNYNYESTIKNKCAEYALKSALHISDKIIFVSEAGRQTYIENFDIDKEKTVVVYNGIEIPDCRISKNNRDYYRLTYLGRVEQIKGIHLLIEAVKKLVEYNYAIKLWIIGDGSYRAELEKMVSRLKLDDNIDFLGTQRDIGHYLSQTDVFIYPSVWQEVFGISIVEAMSYGVPCVSNRVGGIPEIIVNGFNGYISEEKTGKSVFNAIKRILDKYDDGTIAELKENCLRTAKKFSIENTVLNLKKVYGDLVKYDINER